MKRRISIICIVCLAVFLTVTVCHEAFHGDTESRNDSCLCTDTSDDGCVVCVWIHTCRTLLGALLILSAATLCTRLLLPQKLSRLSFIHIRILSETPISLRVKLSD